MASSLQGELARRAFDILPLSLTLPEGERAALRALSRGLLHDRHAGTSESFQDGLQFAERRVPNATRFFGTAKYIPPLQHVDDHACPHLLRRFLELWICQGQLLNGCCRRDRRRNRPFPNRPLGALPRKPLGPKGHGPDPSRRYKVPLRRHTGLAAVLRDGAQHLRLSLQGLLLLLAHRPESVGPGQAHTSKRDHVPANVEESAPLLGQNVDQGVVHRTHVLPTLGVRDHAGLVHLQAIAPELPLAFSWRCSRELRRLSGQQPRNHEACEQPEGEDVCGCRRAWPPRHARYQLRGRPMPAPSERPRVHGEHPG
mmetsp:Transcript_162432/g.520582  ORF Transcript_162432/g.520582 Transcript_162432/m.520582 type:complete len:313 (+) Transcript_162432:273-1211(+)